VSQHQHLDTPALHPVAPRPFYAAVGDEEQIFKAAYSARLPILLKGPTGCGKTRFVEAMAYDLKRPLVTVACHDDLSAADLVGRFLLKGAETVWQDGPLTRAVRDGSICYLDEIVEARSDTLVVLHPLSDHRRLLPIERLNEEVRAHDGFSLVVSYNPGYQSVLKDLKPSTRQRMIAIEFTYPGPEIECEILRREANVDGKAAERLVALATAIRRQDDINLREVASTRALVSAALLIAQGVPPVSAVRHGVIQPLSDDQELELGLMEIAKAIFG
jgi:nitric oxide reductase NorQ protein